MCRLLPLAALVLVAACDAQPAEQGAAAVDPVIAAALAEQLMVDPDLARQNPRNAVLTGGGPASALIPPLDRGAEAVAAARAAAGPVSRAPAPRRGASSGAGETAALTAAAALGTNAAAQDCARKMNYTMVWAARMPTAFPIYPRGHVQEAAGTDQGGCKLRSVNFLSPVPLDDLVDFYWTRARAAGFNAQHRLDAADHVIAASKGGTSATIWLRSRDGLTEVDLVTSGT